MTAVVVDILFEINYYSSTENGHHKNISFKFSPANFGLDGRVYATADWIGTHGFTGVGVDYTGEDEDPGNELFGSLQHVIDHYYQTAAEDILAQLNEGDEEVDYVLGDMVFVKPEVQNAINDAIPDTLDDIDEGTISKSFTATEKTKLSGVATAATANDTDSNLKNRANHTGAQAISTVTGLQTALDAKWAAPSAGAHIADAAVNAPTDADTSVNILALGAALNDSNTKQNTVAANLNAVAAKVNLIFDRLEALGLLATS